MNRPTDDQLLAFLDGTLDREERERLLDRIENDPALARELRLAAMGYAGAEPMRTATADRPTLPRMTPRLVSRWWIPAAVAATLLLAIPTTLRLSSVSSSPEPWTPEGAMAAIMPASLPTKPEGGFVLVLQGRWPDASTVGADEQQRRAREYWAWAANLSNRSVLMAAGDLVWDPGERLGPTGTPIAVSVEIVESPDFIVGMFALRVTTVEDALAIARECPHLRYGGSVSVRQVGQGFLTTHLAGS